MYWNILGFRFEQKKNENESGYCLVGQQNSFQLIIFFLLRLDFGLGFCNIIFTYLNYNRLAGIQRSSPLSKGIRSFGAKMLLFDCGFLRKSEME